VHGLSQTYHRVSNPFGCTRWYSNVTWLIWNLVSVRSVPVLVPEQDRCTVCAKHTIGSEFILDAPIGGDEAQVEARFGPFGDRANIDARKHDLR
jgi:hypothetical protein